MNLEKALQQLEARFPNHPHTVKGSPNLDTWAVANSFYVWKIEETHKDYTVALDYSYGIMALFDKNKLVETGRKFLLYEEIVVLDKDHYGVPRSIYTTVG